MCCTVKVVIVKITYRTTLAFVNGHQRSKQQKPQSISTNHISRSVGNFDFLFLSKFQISKKMNYFQITETKQKTCVVVVFFLYGDILFTFNTNSLGNFFFLSFFFRLEFQPKNYAIINKTTNITAETNCKQQQQKNFLLR